MYSVGTSPPHPSNTTSAFSLGQLDVVHSAGLADTVGDHLQAMFPDELSSRQGSSAPWDTDGSYRASRLRCYLRSHAAPPISSLQEWVSLYIYIYIRAEHQCEVPRFPLSRATNSCNSLLSPLSSLLFSSPLPPYNRVALIHACPHTPFSPSWPLGPANCCRVILYYIT